MKGASHYGETEEKLMADTFNERRKWITSVKEIMIEKVLEAFPLLVHNPIAVS